MMLELMPNPISDIIQGGVLGLAVLMVWVGYKMFCSANLLLTNHMVHILACLAAIDEKMERLVSLTIRSDENAREDARVARIEAVEARSAATATRKARNK